MADGNFRFLSKQRDRHGKWRYLVRRYGRRISIKSPWGTTQFTQEYVAALAQIERPLEPNVGRVVAERRGTMAWLCAQYFETSVKYLNRDPTEKKRGRSILEECMRERVNPESEVTMGELPIDEFTSQHVEVLLGRKVAEGLPGSANNRHKWLGTLFNWALRALPKQVRANPVKLVDRVDYASDGFYTWTVEDVAKFRERHPVGTKAYLALAILMFLGVRRGDAVRLGRQHLKEVKQTDGSLQTWIAFVPNKTKKKRKPGTLLSEKPVLPELLEALAAGPCGDLTFLMTEWGKPFTAPGFGNWFHDRCREAGIPGNAHGVRKAGACIAAENGASEHLLMAIFDWETANQARVYTQQARKKRLLQEGMAVLTRGIG